MAPALYVILNEFFIHRIKDDPRVKGVTDPGGEECKLSGQADDMLLALLPVAGSLEAALAIIDDFSLLSGCKINWKKAKVISILLAETPLRISGDNAHVYLGLPYMEGEENAEVGRRICIRFIRKARAMQVTELTLPARVLAINHILAASLWYFMFAWAPNVADFKRLQDIIKNFLRSKPVDNQKSHSKVAWSVLVHKKLDGGLGLVDPVRKVQILHGPWLIKALSPGSFPWKNFVLDKLEATAAVTGGIQGPYMALSRNPQPLFKGGSPLWNAMWKAWMAIGNDLVWHPPTTRDSVACLPIQGFAKVWTEKRCQTLERSRIIMQAGHLGVECLADLWCWLEHRWKTASELRLDFDVPRCTAKALVEAVHSDLSPEISAAMQVVSPLQKGTWVTDVDSLCSSTHWSQKLAMLVVTTSPDTTEVWTYPVISAHGLLAHSHSVAHRPSCTLSAILVLSRLRKCKWDLAPGNVMAPLSDGATLAWLGLTSKARVFTLVERWRCSTQD